MGGDEANNSNRFSKEISASVQTWFEQFHRWDYIYRYLEEEENRWRTDRHLLTPQALYRRWKDPTQLIGVRFSTNWDGQTSYVLLDTDIQSQHHPYTDETALKNILGSLESIGLSRYIPIRSSDSEGLHIYYLLPDLISCHKISRVMQQTLQDAGVQIRQGQLEIFPNVRSAPKTLYQGHRLPLQEGSYVLDDDWQPIHNSIERLVDTWNAISPFQDIEYLQQALNSYRNHARHQSAIGQEWEERLSQWLKEGFTGKGQTNAILRDLCIYARVYKGLAWDEVEQWVVPTVTSLPGYEKYCNHRHEIRRRIRDWVKTNRKNNRYYPWGSKPKQKQPRGPTNEQRRKEALQRIQDAIAALTEELGELPPQVGKRQDLIQQRAGCSNYTLWKHKHLWHPQFDHKRCVNPCSTRT